MQTAGQLVRQGDSRECSGLTADHDLVCNFCSLYLGDGFVYTHITYRIFLLFHFHLNFNFVRENDVRGLVAFLGDSFYGCIEGNGTLNGLVKLVVINIIIREGDGYDIFLSIDRKSTDCFFGIVVHQAAAANYVGNVTGDLIYKRIYRIGKDHAVYGIIDGKFQVLALCNGTAGLYLDPGTVLLFVHRYRVDQVRHVSGAGDRSAAGRCGRRSSHHHAGPSQHGKRCRFRFCLLNHIGNGRLRILFCSNGELLHNVRCPNAQERQLSVT